jgi:hypothetical protein
MSDIIYLFFFKRTCTELGPWINRIHQIAFLNFLPSHTWKALRSTLEIANHQRMALSETTK